MKDLTGTTLGQYRIVAPLGRGGMAVVYRAYQAGMERYVAVKVIATDQSADPDFLRRFRQEARVIAALEHPNILPVYDYGEAQGFTYLVMRLITTGTLADQLQGRPLPFDRARGIIASVGDALDYAHSRGVVHRDIKPSNILLDERGHSLLSDFGIAKMAQNVTQLTVTGSFIGTPHYASPEQGLGRDLDGRSDLYSLGVVLYEMVTGRQPFVRDTPMAVVFAHIQEPLPPPRALNPAISPALEQVLVRALAKDRNQRYSTAAALTAELTAALAASGAVPTQGLGMARTVLEANPSPAPSRATVGPTNYGPPALTQLDRAPVAAAVGQAPSPAPPATRRFPLAATAAGGCGFLLLLCVIGALGAAFVPGLLPAGLLPSAASVTPVSETLPTSAPQATFTAAPTNTEPPRQPATPRPAPVPPVGSDTIYVEYILDASGSMLAPMDNTTRLAIARRVLAERVAALPPDVNVGLRVYGHRVPFQQEAESCADIELVVPLRQGGADDIIAFLPDMQALGMTPMSESIRLAAEDFTFTPENKNTIILISDGMESCGDDPATVAAFLQELGIDFTIHVIGMDVDAATRDQLSRLAATGRGIYHDANSEVDLLAALGEVEAAAVAPIATPSTPSTASAPGGSPTSTATLAPTDTATPTPGQPVEAARLGTVQASTSYQGFPASLATDGDLSTSWFSAGSNFDGADSTFTWTGQQDDYINAVTIRGNASNEVVEYRTGFGFDLVVIQVLDASGAVVFEESAALGGTPDPDVTVFPAVIGRSIVLTFTGHESPDCGGFAELSIEVLR